MNHSRQDGEREVRPAPPVMSVWLMALVLGVTVGLWLGALALVSYSKRGWPELGQIGDSFGALNALFSGLGFAGIVLTLLLQSKQIRIQQLDVQRQLDEMRTARATQLQPFVAVSPDKSQLLSHPRHFLGSPIGDEVGTKFTVRSTLTNASRDPAINVRVSSRLIAASAADAVYEDSIPLPIMPEKEADFEGEFFISYKTIISCLEDLIVPVGMSAREIAARPANVMLEYRISFENTLGVTFELKQSFSLYVSEDSGVLRGWVADWKRDNGIASPVGDSVKSVGVSVLALPGTSTIQALRT